MQPSDDDTPGRNLAVAAETLFLANLMLAPGIAFLALAWLRHRHPQAPTLARCHLEQAFFAGLWSGVLLLAATGVLLALGGLHWEWTWVFVIIYFTCIHASLILAGIVALAKAQAGQPYRYPFIGPHHD